jgi:hypothetical protein
MVRSVAGPIPIPTQTKEMCMDDPLKTPLDALTALTQFQAEVLSVLQASRDVTRLDHTEPDMANYLMGHRDGYHQALEEVGEQLAEHIAERRDRFPTTVAAPPTFGDSMYYTAITMLLETLLRTARDGDLLIPQESVPFLAETMLAATRERLGSGAQAL